VIGVSSKKEVCVLHGVKTYVFCKFIYLYIFNQKKDRVMADTKLTTVKIIKDIYSKFKRISFDSNITLQKLVNRSVDKYIEDDVFRNEINGYQNLHESGSQF